MQPNTRRYGLTQLSNGAARVLSSKVGLSEACSPESGDPQPNIIFFNGVWDTGASGSVISRRVVSTLNLQPIDEQKSQTANGEYLANVYLVNIYLPNKVVFSGMRVTDGDIFGTDVLIGMDIVNAGDFVITNVEGKTCMSFQIPSVRRIDFVKEIKMARATRGKRKKKRNKDD